MRIRLAKENDFEQISKLMLKLYERWDKIDPIDKIDKSWFGSSDNLDYFKKILEDENKLLLVVEDKTIVGYLLAGIKKRMPFLQNVGYIAETYILPEYRGKGIGSKLYNKAMDWFKGLRFITVSTHSFDKGANKFWKKKGFEEFNKYLKLEIK
jgi:ribosomal protein S18 acetylase RimI-like enzyme